MHHPRICRRLLLLLRTMLHCGPNLSQKAHRSRSPKSKVHLSRSRAEPHFRLKMRTSVEPKIKCRTGNRRPAISSRTNRGRANGRRPTFVFFSLDYRDPAPDVTLCRCRRPPAGGPTRRTRLAWRARTRAGASHTDGPRCGPAARPAAGFLSRWVRSWSARHLNRRTRTKIRRRLSPGALWIC